jgi:DNA-nicking Smr family endonuclease
MRDADTDDANADDSNELFRKATRDVKRLTIKTTVVAKPKPKPIARFSRADNRAVLQESLDPVADPALLETGDEMSFRRPGIPDTLLRKLRRGHFSVDAEIDLHGLTSPQARNALREFIAYEVTRGARCVRVIHGKGLGSGPRGPVLKNVVNIWLRRAEVVLAFGSARPLDGGSGAVYVLLNSH